MSILVTPVVMSFLSFFPACVLHILCIVGIVRIVNIVSIENGVATVFIVSSEGTVRLVL